MPGGRPTLLTPELQQKLCDLIAAGNYYEAACAHVGISYRAFRKWIVLGKKATQGQHFQLVQAVKRAEAAAEVRVVEQWQAHIPDNWQAAATFLERRHPKRWARKQRVAQRVTLDDVLAQLPPEEAAAVRRVLAERGTQPPPPRLAQ